MLPSVMPMSRDEWEYLEALGYRAQPWINDGKALPKAIAPAPQPVAPTRAPAPATTGTRDFSTFGWDLLESTAKACVACRLSQGRKNVVFGVGNRNADLMFIGEGPGADEDAQGIPFVGKAGQLLTKMIEAMGLARDDVYIANVVKCSAPENRNPEPDEIAACSPFLARQIQLVNPRVIVSLGKFAVQTLLQKDVSIMRLRGNVQDLPGHTRADGSPIIMMPTLHPAYLLREPEAKKDVWADLQAVMRILGLPGKSK